MWKILLAFLSHRSLLLVVAVVSLGSSSAGRPVWEAFSDRVAEGAEVGTLSELMRVPPAKVFEATYSPFLWLGRWLGAVGLSPIVSVLLLSNLFFLLFLYELNALFNRLTTPDVAVFGAILVLLWPTTYEMSLGASLSMSCFFVALTLRHSLDGRWVVAGIGLAGLALVEPLAAGLVPLLIYFFWYLQRHDSPVEQLKLAAVFLVPFALVVVWRWSVYRSLGAIVDDSALFRLFESSKGRGLGWTFASSVAGQTVSILFFLAGAGSALFSNSIAVHRILPLWMLILVLLFSPYGALASRLPLAGLCLQGIASACSGPVARAVVGLLIALGAFEIYAVFR